MPGFCCNAKARHVYKEEVNLKATKLSLSLIFLLMLTLAFSGCNEEADPEQIGSNVDAFTWVVQPILEHEQLWYCSHCDVFWQESGLLVDPETGAVIDDYKMGHGGGATLVFDYQQNLIGRAGNLYSGPAEMYPFADFATNFPQLSSLVFMVQGVDSSLRIVEHGEEMLADEAFSGQFAVIYNGNLVTDFIFDDGGSNTASGGRLTGTIVAARLDGSWGIINNSGNTVVPFIFEHILIIDDETAFAQYNGYYGIIRVQPATTL